MPHIGAFMIADPLGLARRLQALSRALRSEVDMALDPHRLSPGSVFLNASPFELDARVTAVATIFGRQGALRLLTADMGVLRYAPQELNKTVMSLRSVFAARGYGKPQEQHVGTPEGAAEAVANRAYVTELTVAWPELLALPGRLEEAGVAGLLEMIKVVGRERYGGDEGRAALLADVAARPQVLSVAEAAQQLPPRQAAEMLQRVLSPMSPAAAEAEAVGESR